MRGQICQFEPISWKLRSITANGGYLNLSNILEIRSCGNSGVWPGWARIKTPKYVKTWNKKESDLINCCSVSAIKSKYKWFNNDYKMKAINQPFSFFINTLVKINLLPIDELKNLLFAVKLPTSISWIWNIPNIFVFNYKSVNTKDDTIQTN